MPDSLNALTERIIGAAIAVHRELGPGLLESAYQACLTFELAEAGVPVETQKPLPLVYRGVRMNCAYRLDVVVAEAVIVEVKSVDHLDRIHEAQVLSYLRLSGCRVGLLMNFNVRCLAYGGIKRLVHRLTEP